MRKKILSWTCVIAVALAPLYYLLFWDFVPSPIMNEVTPGYLQNRRDRAFYNRAILTYERELAAVSSLEGGNTVKRLSDSIHKTRNFRDENTSPNFVSYLVRKIAD